RKRPRDEETLDAGKLAYRHPTNRGRRGKAAHRLSRARLRSDRRVSERSPIRDPNRRLDPHDHRRRGSPSDARLPLRLRRRCGYDLPTRSPGRRAVTRGTRRHALWRPPSDGRGQMGEHMANRHAQGSPLTKRTMTLPRLASFVVVALVCRSGLSDEGPQLFHKMQAALGGADKIAAIRDFEQLVRADAIDGNTGLSLGAVRKRTRWIRPNLVRVDQIGP